MGVSTDHPKMPEQGSNSLKDIPGLTVENPFIINSNQYDSKTFNKYPREGIINAIRTIITLQGRSHYTQCINCHTQAGPTEVTLKGKPITTTLGIIWQSIASNTPRLQCEFCMGGNRRGGTFGSAKALQQVIQIMSQQPRHTIYTTNIDLAVSIGGDICTLTDNNNGQEIPRKFAFSVKYEPQEEEEENQISDEEKIRVITDSKKRSRAGTITSPKQISTPSSFKGFKETSQAQNASILRIIKSRIPQETSTPIPKKRTIKQTKFLGRESSLKLVTNKDSESEVDENSNNDTDTDSDISTFNSPTSTRKLKMEKENLEKKLDTMIQRNEQQQDLIEYLKMEILKLHEQGETLKQKLNYIKNTKTQEDNNVQQQNNNDKKSEKTQKNAMTSNNQENNINQKNVLNFSTIVQQEKETTRPSQQEKETTRPIPTNMTIIPENQWTKVVPKNIRPIIAKTQEPVIIKNKFDQLQNFEPNLERFTIPTIENRKNNNTGRKKDDTPKTTDKNDAKRDNIPKTSHNKPDQNFPVRNQTLLRLQQQNQHLKPEKVKRFTEAMDFFRVNKPRKTDKIESETGMAIVHIANVIKNGKPIAEIRQNLQKFDIGRLQHCSWAGPLLEVGGNTKTLDNLNRKLKNYGGNMKFLENVDFTKPLSKSTNDKEDGCQVAKQSAVRRLATSFLRLNAPENWQKFIILKAEQLHILDELEEEIQQRKVLAWLEQNEMEEHDDTSEATNGKPTNTNTPSQILLDKVAKAMGPLNKQTPTPPTETEPNTTQAGKSTPHIQQSVQIEKSVVTVDDDDKITETVLTAQQPSIIQNTTSQLPAQHIPTETEDNIEQPIQVEKNVLTTEEDKDVEISQTVQQPPTIQNATTQTSTQHSPTEPTTENHTTTETPMEIENNMDLDKEPESPGVYGEDLI